MADTYPYPPSDPDSAPSTEPSTQPTVTVPVDVKVPVPVTTNADGSEVEVKLAKERRPAQLLATLGIILITAGTSIALGYIAVIAENQQAISTITTIATLGLGGLLALTGTNTGKDR